MNIKEDENIPCDYCHDNTWLVKSEKRLEGVTPFIFPCPMCNPHGKKAPPVVERDKINNLIEFRKTVVKEIETNE